MIFNKRFIPDILSGKKRATCRPFSPKRADMAPGRTYTLQSGYSKGGKDNFAVVRCVKAEYLTDKMTDTRDWLYVGTERLEALGHDTNWSYLNEFWKCFPGYNGTDPMIYYEWELLEDLTI